MGDRVVVDLDGSVRPEDDEARQRLSALAGRYRIAADAAGLILLKRDDGPSQSGRVLMAGEIISRMTVMEIIGVIAQVQWRGELTLMSNPPAGVSSAALSSAALSSAALSSGIQRKLSFDQGALKHARSTAIGERLGEVMLRAGVVTRSQLDELLSQLEADQRFGQLCVARGLIDRQELFQHLQSQSEQIFFNALLMGEGCYAFALPGEAADADPPPNTVHIAIQSLLMEGVQRIDEMALFRDKIPGSHMVPDLVSGAPELKKPDENVLAVRPLCDGQRSIDEISRLTGLGEFLTTKAVFHLLQQKQIVLHTTARVGREALTELVDRFNEVMQDIFVAVATYGGVQETRETLASWIQGSGYAPYFGEGVDDYGCLEPERVADALVDSDVDNPVEGLYQGLHELAAFALFSATTTLPRDQELSLARHVNARLKTIRME